MKPLLYASNHCPSPLLSISSQSGRWNFSTKNTNYSPKIPPAPPQDITPSILYRFGNDPTTFIFPYKMSNYSWKIITHVPIYLPWVTPMHMEAIGPSSFFHTKCRIIGLKSSSTFIWTTYKLIPTIWPTSTRVTFNLPKVELFAYNHPRPTMLTIRNQL